MVPTPNHQAIITVSRQFQNINQSCWRYILFESTGIQFVFECFALNTSKWAVTQLLVFTVYLKLTHRLCFSLSHWWDRGEIFSSTTESAQPAPAWHRMAHTWLAEHDKALHMCWESKSGSVPKKKSTRCWNIALHIAVQKLSCREHFLRCNSSGFLRWNSK